MTDNVKPLFDLYKYFKLKSVQFRVIPMFNSVGSTYLSNQSAPSPTSIGVGAPALVYVWESNEDTVYNQGPDIMHKSNSKIIRSTHEFKTFRRLRPNMDVQLNAASSVSTVRMKSNPWISTTDKDFTYGRWLISTLAPSDGDMSKLKMSYNIIATCYYSFKTIK